MQRNRLQNSSPVTLEGRQMLAASQLVVNLGSAADALTFGSGNENTAALFTDDGFSAGFGIKTRTVFEDFDFGSDNKTVLEFVNDARESFAFTVKKNPNGATRVNLTNRIQNGRFRITNDGAADVTKQDVIDRVNNA